MLMNFSSDGKLLSLFKQLLLVILLFFTTDSLHAAQVSLQWQSNDFKPDGYRLYQRTSGNSYNYNAPAWTGANTICTVNNLQEGTQYYFVVRAYVGTVESGNSNEVYHTPSAPTPTDADTDGYSVAQGDCNDDNPAIHPGATEICGDGIDQNCDGKDMTCPADNDYSADRLNIAAVTASGDDGNIAENTIDGSLDTRWSARGDGQWIEYDLGSLKNVNAISIAFFNGDQRTNSFSIQASVDGTEWTEAFSGISSGTTAGKELFEFPESVDARYIRYIGFGNSLNDWNSVTEVEILGVSSDWSNTADNLNIAAVAASGDDGNIAENTIDGSLDTRWSARGEGQWIEYDLGSLKNVNAISIAFFNGDRRTNIFSIDASVDGTEWTEVFSGTSSGTTTSQELFEFTESVDARYIRYTGFGNSLNDWNSVAEVDIFGVSPIRNIIADNLNIAAVAASGDDGNIAENTIDGSLDTRWSARGEGQWIEYDLGSLKNVNAISIAFFNGDQRTNTFSIQASVDGTEWTEAFSRTSSGTMTSQELFEFTESVDARYIRYIGFGNSLNDWNSITEVDIIGN